MTAKNSNRNAVIFESREFKNVKEFSAFIGKPYGYCLSRLNQGLSPEEVLSAPFRWYTAIQNLVVIEGKMYHSMKFATLAYTGVYDDSEYRKYRRNNKGISVVDALHYIHHKKLLERLGRLKEYKNNPYDLIKSAANKLLKSIERSELNLFNRRDVVVCTVGFCIECGDAYRHESTNNKSYIYYSKANTGRACCSTGCWDTRRSRQVREGSRIQKLRRGKNSHRRRAKRYGGSWIAGITWRSVADRNGMKCAVCGVRCIIPRGKNKPNEATVGHVIAMANGGDHGWHNVQMECRSCNSIHGSNDHGQMGLDVG